MFAKVVVLLVSMGLLAGALLANRQQRIQAAHDLADAQRRLSQHDRDLWRLRLEIAARVTPARVEAAANRLGTLVPIRAERYTDLLTRLSEQRELDALTQLDPDALVPERD